MTTDLKTALDKLTAKLEAMDVALQLSRIYNARLNEMQQQLWLEKQERRDGEAMTAELINDLQRGLDALRRDILLYTNK